MKPTMIFSAAGWRKVFAASGDQEDASPEISGEDGRLTTVAARVFSGYLRRAAGGRDPVIALGRDTRPTGGSLIDAALKGLLASRARVRLLGVCAAPEIMAYARDCDGFMFISASHNPVGHNGFKFGLNDGGVLPPKESRALTSEFKAALERGGVESEADEKLIAASRTESEKWKREALGAYGRFIRRVITGCDDSAGQESVLSAVKDAVKAHPLTVVCDMNGSARAHSIDRTFFASCGIPFVPFNESAIAHGIIPEGENLSQCAARVEEEARKSRTGNVLGYMPDCDGDRGNTVFFDGRAARIINAQTGFALCVVSELCFERWKGGDTANLAVVVNGPTSMRIDDICSALGARVFRAEVGEANVVALAAEKRAEGFNVRILGEGSNGGNITHPSHVRDPLATIFALIKLLTLRSTPGRRGLFEIWCGMSHQSTSYKEDFTLSDVIATLPKYATTGAAEKRAVLHMQTEDKGLLKENFRRRFLASWDEKKAALAKELGIAGWECFTTNGTSEVENAEAWRNGNGGLKIKFLDKDGSPAAFMWMRPSGTEPVFRIMCDVRGDKPEAERRMLEWETALLLRADRS